MEYKPELVNAVSQNLPLYLADRAADDVLARLNAIYEKYRLDHESDPAKRRAVFLKEAEEQFPLPAGFPKSAKKPRHILSAILLEQPEFIALGRKLFGPMAGNLLQAIADEWEDLQKQQGQKSYRIDMFFSGVDLRIPKNPDFPGDINLVTVTIRNAFPALNRVLERGVEKALSSAPFQFYGGSQPTTILDNPPPPPLRGSFANSVWDLLRTEREPKHRRHDRDTGAAKPYSEGIAPTSKKEPN